MKKIAVVTATRAEYGLLAPVIRELRQRENDNLRVELIVTGTHLSEQYGQTVLDIDQRIDRRISIPVNSKTELDISKNQAEALRLFSELFIKEKYDAVMVLGDRYETLATAIAAGNTRTPVFHLCGGDTTEGAMDEWIRHCITKISYLHFVTNEQSRRRVIQLGENPSRVFNFGSTSIDNILSIQDMGKVEALNSIGLEDCRYALCTFHPITMEENDAYNQISALLAAIRAFPELQFVVTGSNADCGGARINEFWEAAAKFVNNLHVFASLGVRRYLSLMRHAEFVLGNSSSGVIEAPALRTPTVNIGNRQRGRLTSASVVNCGYGTEEIVSTMRRVMSKEHRALCSTVTTPYGDGHAAERIAEKAIEVVITDRIDLKKEFYDFPTGGNAQL